MTGFSPKDHAPVSDYTRTGSFTIIGTGPENGLRSTLLYDASEVMRMMDNRVLEPDTVGIWCDGTQINVGAFRVIAL